MKKLLFLSLVLVACSSPKKTLTVAPPSLNIAPNSAEAQKSPTVILVSIDGYRHDYTDRFSPPNIKKFRDEGLAAKSLIPSYPTKTFPNHYTIVTGLYPEHHGIVSNNFFDFSRPDGKKAFKLSLKDATTDGSWYGGIPLWSAAENSGMRSACFFWPGAEAEIAGVRPSTFVPFDDSIPNDKRVNTVLSWLKMPEATRPHFITLYFSDVDTAGHEHGTESKQVQEAVMNIDAKIGMLLNGVKESKIPVNVILVSDHGMVNLDGKKVVNLDEYTDFSKVSTADSGPQMFIYNTSGDPKVIEQIYSDLKKHEDHYKVYKQGKFPRDFNFNDAKRSGDLTVVAEMPYTIGTAKLNAKIPVGTHGYHPKNKEMHAIFYASGPNIKKGKIPSVNNVDLYPFMMKLLGLKVNGQIDGKEQAWMKKALK